MFADNRELSFALLKAVCKKVGKLQRSSFGGAAQELADDAGVVLQGPIPECGVGRHEAFVDQVDCCAAAASSETATSPTIRRTQIDWARGLGRRWVGQPAWRYVGASVSMYPTPRSV